MRSLLVQKERTASCGGGAGEAIYEIGDAASWAVEARTRSGARWWRWLGSWRCCCTLWANGQVYDPLYNLQGEVQAAQAKAKGKGKTAA